MKKSLFALAMAACLALTGCSGVSQEEYDEVVEENEHLASEVERIEQKAESYNQEVIDGILENERLSNENNALKAQNDFLNNQLNYWKGSDEACFVTGNGNKWYYDGFYYTYIDEDKNDEDIVSNAYGDLLFIMEHYPDKSFINFIAFRDKNGTNVAMTALSYIVVGKNITAYINENKILWCEEYEYLNDNSYNLEQVKKWETNYPCPVE